MNKSLVLKGLIAILIVCIFAMSAMSCKFFGGNDGDGDGTGEPGGDSGITDGGNDDGNDDGNTDEDKPVDKAALNTELALEVKEQGDYTADSYNAYQACLAEAKAVAADSAATQQSVDYAAVALNKARLNLTVRSVLPVEGANRQIDIVSGGSREIALTDYIDINGLSKITYKLLSSNEIVTLGDVEDGKFTLTAAEVSGVAYAKVSINVYYDNTPKLTVELPVKITNDVAPTLGSEEFVKEYDMVALGNREELVIDFAENISNSGELAITYSAKCGDEELSLDGSTYTLALGSYTEEAVYVSFTVTLSFSVNGEARTLEYTYKLGLKDTGKYNIANGGFEFGLDGWTFTNTVGEAPFAGIDNKTHYWVQEFPMNNVGSYFSAYADGASEGSQGTLASPYFIVNSNYATYMLGGAGNPNVYITIENEAGEVLALYRNTKFADIPEGVTDFAAQRELVGKTIFLANFVTYKADISAFAGQKVRFVVHDHASEGWGVVFFDELNVYYASEDDIPEDAVLAENLLASKDALNAELALEVKEQGDYTADSYNVYLEKFAAAKALVNDYTVAQATVDAATAALTEARLALAVRPIVEIEGANKSFRLTSGGSLEIDLADYLDLNGLSNISYKLVSSNSSVSLGSIVDGKFTVTAGSVSNVTEAVVSIIVCHGGEEKLTVELSIQVTNDLTPVILNEELVREYDIFELENKTDLTIDLSENVDNAGNLVLIYSVNGNTVDGSIYTITLGEYTDVVAYENLTVTISYFANGEAQSASYVYKLGLYDSTECRLENGDFENGLDGWTQVGNIGGVSSDTHYWVNDPERAEGYEFGMDGVGMFSGYAFPELEKNVGTLTSSSFVVGGSGFVTFKLGAMRDGNYVYVDVVDADTKEILARYYNGLWAERTDDVKSGCTLIAYKADLSAFAGREVFFRISDNADSGYGLFFADSFVTYYAQEPDGFNDAIPVDYEIGGTIYDLFNGGFELGDVQGWWNVGNAGAITGADAFFSGVAYGKDGNFLYSGIEDAASDENGNVLYDENGNVIKVGNGREGNKGSLTSSVFELGGNGYISFMLGGGNDSCYVQVLDATTGEILARFRQQAREDGVLKTYVADLSAYIGRSLRIQLIDGATFDWGCVSFDNVVTYHNSIPEGIVAIDVKYEMVNGSFENGLNGWDMFITEAGAYNTLGWVESSEHDAGWYTKNDGRKDGNNLFTFCRPDGTNCENTKGSLNSAVFTLKQGSFVSFRFGGAGTRDVYIELCKANGEVIATFYNEAPGKINTEMFAYYYQYTGEEADCFFRVVDNSTSNYGCFVVDDFRVNLEGAPEGFIAAIQ